MNTVMAKKPQAFCPACNKSNQMVPVKYGYPASVLVQDEQSTELPEGTCFISEKVPLWFCKTCLLEFGQPFNRKNLPQIGLESGY